MENSNTQFEFMSQKMDCEQLNEIYKQLMKIWSRICHSDMSVLKKIIFI